MNGNVGLSDPPLVAAGFGVLSIDNSAATASARLSDSSSPEKQNEQLGQYSFCQDDL